jgi:hypothetical protein
MHCENVAAGFSLRCLDQFKAENPKLTTGN